MTSVCPKEDDESLPAVEARHSSNAFPRGRRSVESVGRAGSHSLGRGASPEAMPDLEVEGGRRPGWSRPSDAGRVARAAEESGLDGRDGGPERAQKRPVSGQRERRGEKDRREWDRAQPQPADARQPKQRRQGRRESADEESRKENWAQGLPQT